MLAAARIGFSMSWKLIMLAEIFGSPGVSASIRINYTVYDLTTLLRPWSSIFVLALLIIEQPPRVSERRLVVWRA